MNVPLKYNFTNFNLISQDVEKRNYFYRKTAALLERKAELDNNYANMLEHIINKDYVRNTNNNIASQALYGKLVEIMLEEPVRVKEMAAALKEEADMMNTFIQSQSNELKKMLESANKISKEIQSQREKLEKSKAKYDKRNQELQSSKVKYLSCVIGTEQLQKINQLYLEVNSLEDSVKPLFDDFRAIADRFHGSANKMVEQFDIILQKVEEIEVKKIQYIKSAVNKYVRKTKNNLDEVMEKYPFLCEYIDRIREKGEFVPHSEHSLISESRELDNITLRQYNYIDSIYDRIEKKKNLEEIILYGQNIEHKKNLTNSFVDITQSDATELLPNTYRMVEIFKAVFEGSSNQEMIEELKFLLEGDQKMRKDFILCLQQFRINNEFELNVRSKQCITSCILAFLDVCHHELDTYNSKMLMVLSMTYHFNEEKGKVELHELIRNHEIWNHTDWWQAALLETIYEEIRVKSGFKEVPVRIWDIKAGGICRKEEGEEQTYQYICFNQLLFFVRNMSLFNLNPQIIVQYAKLNINILKFTGKLARDILDLCPQAVSPSLRKREQSSP